MSQDEPSAEDGSFVRSAGGAMLRGVMLIVVAVVLGIVLLQGTDGPDPFTAATEDTTDTTDTTGGGDDGGTPTTVPSIDDDDTTDTTEVAPPPVDPSTITVLVANGSGGEGGRVAGLAGAVTEVVSEAGYETAPPTNSEPVESSVVYHAPGFEEAAAAVAQLFDPAPQVAPLPDPSPVEDLRGANVVLVASGDLAE